MVDRRVAIGGLAAATVAVGVGYPVTAGALSALTPAAFVGWRLLLAGVCLLVLAFPTRSSVWRDGSIGGALLFVGCYLQAVAIGDTDAGVTAVLVSVFLVLGPALASLARRTAPAPWIVVGGVVAFVGVVLFTLRETFGPEAREWTALASALALAAYLVHLSRVVSRHELVPLLGVQCLVAGTVSLVAAWAGADLRLPDPTSLAAVIGTGVAATAMPVVVGVWAQARLGTQTTRLVTAGVPLVAVAASGLVRGERLGITAWMGAALVVAAAMVASLDTADADMAAAASVSAAR